jgi:hypothetical protein
MKLEDFPEVNTTIAKNQPEYLPIPAYRYKGDDRGRIVFCWKPSWRERFELLFGGVLWHHVLTFNHPLQPQMLTTVKPEMPPHV